MTDHEVATGLTAAFTANFEFLAPLTREDAEAITTMFNEVLKQLKNGEINKGSSNEEQSTALQLTRAYLANPKIFIPKGDRQAKAVLQEKAGNLTNFYRTLLSGIKSDSPA